MKACEGTAGAKRLFGPGRMSAFSQTACPLACSCAHRSESSSRHGSTAASCLKSSFRCRVPSDRQRSRNSRKLRSVSGTAALKGDGCAMMGRLPGRSPSLRRSWACSSVATMMSASIAVMSGFASARSSLEIEQQECSQCCCARGRGVYGGPQSCANANPREV